MTGVDSLSDLLSLLLTRYGRHLKSTWEMSPQQQQVVNPVANSAQVFAPVAAESQFQQPYYVREPEPTPEPPIDPEIARIASLIDDF